MARRGSRYRRRGAARSPRRCEREVGGGVGGRVAVSELVTRAWCSGERDVVT